MRVERARAWYRSGRYGEALELLARARADERQDLDVPLLIAVCRAALGDPAGVPGALDQGLELLLTRCPLALLPLDPLEELVGRGQGTADPGPTRTDFADHRARRALRLLHAGRCHEALDESEAALGLNPTYVAARLLAARVSLMLGQTEAASGHLMQALAVHPEYPDLLAWLGLARARARRFAEAATALESALRVNRRFARAARLQAVVEHALARTGEALRAARRSILWQRAGPSIDPGAVRASDGAVHDDEADLLRAIAVHPSYPDLHLALARHRRLEGRWMAAREACRRALALAPSLPQAAFELSRIELGLGKPDRTIQGLATVLRSRPGWADAHALLGRARHLAGDPAAAEGAWRMALDLAPEYSAARSGLGWTLLRQGRAAEAAVEFARSARSGELAPVAHGLLDPVAAQAARANPEVLDPPVLESAHPL